MAQIKSRGSPILPEVLGRRPNKSRAPVRMSARIWMLLCAILLLPPLITYWLSSLVHPISRWHDHVAHAMLEGFCALIALMVFYVFRQAWTYSGGARLCLMAHGFLLFGILNLLHAISPPGSNTFILLHSVSGATLAMMLACSAVVTGSFEDPIQEDRHPRRAAITLLFCMLGILIGCTATIVAVYLPAQNSDGSFTALSSAVNLLAAVCFLAAGWIFAADFRRSGKPIFLGLCIAALLLAESHALFPISRLWDLPWWAWHVINLIVFLGILFGMAYEFTRTLNELLFSNRALHASLAAIEEQNRKLEKTHAELGAAQVSLVRAERLAALGQMAAVLSHEIRNPLGTLSNCIGLLKRPQLPPKETSRVLELAETHIDQLNRVVTDTLSSVRSEASSCYRPLHLAELVDEFISNYPRETLREMELTADKGADVPVIWGSKQHLQQLVWNLVTNSAEAMDGKGQIRLRVTAEAGAAVLRLIDTGSGVPPPLLNRIFEPLVTSKPGGTGLGLSIAKTIVMEHGGSIKVESTGASGTCVAVRFPPAISQDMPQHQVAG